MKKYKLFAGEQYYPIGGYEDFKGNFDSLEEAMQSFDNTREAYCGQWAHIVCDDVIIMITESGFIPETIDYTYTWKKPNEPYNE